MTSKLVTLGDPLLFTTCLCFAVHVTGFKPYQPSRASYAHAELFSSSRRYCCSPSHFVKENCVLKAFQGLCARCAGHVQWATCLASTNTRIPGSDVFACAQAFVQLTGRSNRTAGHRRAITDTDKAVLQLKTQRRQLTAQRTRVGCPSVMFPVLNVRMTWFAFPRTC